MIGSLTFAIMELRKHVGFDYEPSMPYSELFQNMKSLPPFSARWVLGEGENPPLDTRNQAMAELLVNTWGYNDTYARALEIRRMLKAIAED